MVREGGRLDCARGAGVLGPYALTPNTVELIPTLGALFSSRRARLGPGPHKTPPLVRGVSNTFPNPCCPPLLASLGIPGLDGSAIGIGVGAIGLALEPFGIGVGSIPPGPGCRSEPPGVGHDTVSPWSRFPPEAGPSRTRSSPPPTRTARGCTRAAVDD